MMPDGTTLAERHRPSSLFRPDVAADALAGLLASRKTLPAKLFYDDEGCRLFEAITDLPEYYVTRTETALLRAIASAVAARLPSGLSVVEYGAGNENKAALLLAALDAPRAYVPIDVAPDAVNGLAARLSAGFPDLAVLPVAADFMQPFPLPAGVGTPRLGFFPGSTIGNLHPHEAAGFLADARRVLGSGSSFLIGVDLRKPAAILIPAYDDPAGVTAAFNRNLLVRLNREAGADFDPERFAHCARWNDAESRIEMHLVSRRHQVVQVAGYAIPFAEGESIHTENSYKYTVESFQSLAARSGWSSLQLWTDPDDLVSLHLLHAGDPS